MAPPSRAVDAGKAAGLDGKHGPIDAAEAATVGDAVDAATVGDAVGAVTVGDAAEAACGGGRRAPWQFDRHRSAGRYGLRPQPYQPMMSAITLVAPGKVASTHYG